MAVGALEAIHMKKKLKVPQEVALIGFDDFALAEALDPPLTVVRQPAYEVGRAAAEMLLKRLGDRSLPAAWLRLRPRLIVRNSC